ncbi:winged helix-turn-helix domain-containing protein [Phyllobacterium sp. SB3]|uniref:winged helix-turn-helix domain-containing protein n=1 Tax=Phyllobacterium sp. SB3 TaxID=3156073 RepID=UPI0032AF76DB
MGVASDLFQFKRFSSPLFLTHVILHELLLASDSCPSPEMCKSVDYQMLDTDARAANKYLTIKHPPEMARWSVLSAAGTILMASSEITTISFGSFTLKRNGRILLYGNEPVGLGARAFDLLWFLASRPNTIISKQELLASVWPEVSVEEVSLRFHINKLRKALAKGEEASRYIFTATGRGYYFAASTIVDEERSEQRAVSSLDRHQPSLPGVLNHIYGRTEDSEAICSLVLAKRLVTVVGSGGVGKTTVAVSVALNLAANFRENVHFVDLGSISDPSLVEATVASTLGVSPQTGDPTSALVAYLSNRRVLIVLDTCEHLIDEIAELGSRIYAGAPNVYLLSTSREPLEIEGEHVHKLAPLAYPPEHTCAAEQIGDYPASQLLLERALASGAQLDLTRDAAVIAEICRKVDGLPLAIELAAARVASYGAQKTSELLDERLNLFWPGHRTAPIRQRTLQATLDWSFGLLSEIERKVLRRLAVFVGDFTIDAALEVVTNTLIDPTAVLAALDSLVKKSMVATRPGGEAIKYRLLDSTRSYALSIEVEDGQQLAARHARFYLESLRSSEHAWYRLQKREQRGSQLGALANVRTALAWCFGTQGNIADGVRLTAAASPLLLSLSSLAESYKWISKAISSLDQHTIGTLDEMRLQSALGVSLMFMRGESAAARKSLERSLEIADERGTVLDRVNCLGPLFMFHLSVGQFRTTHRLAERAWGLTTKMNDPAAKTLGQSLLGISFHMGGDLPNARSALQAASRLGATLPRSATYLGFQGGVSEAFLARTLWLEGRPNEAKECAKAAIVTAEQSGHPLSLSIALLWATSVFSWNGDLEVAEEYARRLVDFATIQSFLAHRAVGAGLLADLDIARGNVDIGIEALTDAVETLNAANYGLQATPLALALAKGLLLSNQPRDALSLVSETKRTIESNGDLLYLPEALRLEGMSLRDQELPSAAENCFRQCLEESRRQGSIAWALRGALESARVKIAHGQRAAAIALLTPIIERFERDSYSGDLAIAKRMIASE